METDIEQNRGATLNEKMKYSDILTFLTRDEEQNVLKQQQNEISQALDNLMLKDYETSSQSNSVQQNRIKLNLSSERKKQDLEHLQELEEKANKQNETYVFQIQKLNECISKQEEEYKNRLFELETQYQSQVFNQEELQKNHSQTLKKLDEKEIQISMLQKQLSVKEKEYQNFIKEVEKNYRDTHLLDKIKKKDEELKNLEVELEKNRQEKLCLQSKTDELEKTLFEQSQEIQNRDFLTKELSEKDKLIKKMRRLLENYEREQNENLHLKEKLNAAKRDLEEELENLQKRNLSLDEELHLQKEQLKQQKETILRQTSELKNQATEIETLKSNISNNVNQIHAVFSTYGRIGTSFCAIYLANLLSQRHKKIALLDLSLTKDNIGLTAFFNNVDMERHKLYEQLFISREIVKKDNLSLYRYKNIEVFSTAFSEHFTPSVKQILQALENLQEYVIVLDLPSFHTHGNLIDNILCLNAIYKYLVVQEEEYILKQITDTIRFSLESIYADFTVIFNKSNNKNLANKQEILKEKIGIRNTLVVPEFSRKDVMAYQNKYDVFSLF